MHKIGIIITKISGDQREIINALRCANEGIYLEKLMKSTGEVTDAERSRLSYHISDLKADNLVETKKEGRKLLIRLTFAGRLYSEGL